MSVIVDLIRRNVLLGASLFLFLFLSYHMIYSKTGFLMKHALAAKVAEAQLMLDSVVGDREQKEHVISLLKADNLDLDLLEEQARLQFNVKAKNEILVSE